MLTEGDFEGEDDPNGAEAEIIVLGNGWGLQADDEGVLWLVYQAHPEIDRHFLQIGTHELPNQEMLKQGINLIISGGITTSLPS